MRKNKPCVYILCDNTRDRIYKVGVTTGAIEKRIKKLQTGNSGEIFLVDYYETNHPFFTEKWLHKRFEKYKVMNEWFELPDEEVFKFKEYCENIDKMVEVMGDSPFFPKNIK